MQNGRIRGVRSCNEYQVAASCRIFQGKGLQIGMGLFGDTLNNRSFFKRFEFIN